VITKIDGFFDDASVYEVTCDLCGHSEEYADMFDFAELRREMGFGGWVSKKNHLGQWIHACQDCVKEAL